VAGCGSLTVPDSDSLLPTNGVCLALATGLSTVEKTAFSTSTDGWKDLMLTSFVDAKTFSIDSPLLFCVNVDDVELTSLAFAAAPTAEASSSSSKKYKSVTFVEPVKHSRQTELKSGEFGDLCMDRYTDHESLSPPEFSSVQFSSGLSAAKTALISRTNSISHLLLRSRK